MRSLPCLVSAVCFGLMAIFAKLAYADGVGVDALLLLRFGLAAAVLCVVGLVRGWFAGLGGRAVLTGLAMGAIGYAAQAGLYLTALTHTAASQVALVFCGYPLLVMVGAILIGRERASRRRSAALGIALAGIVLVLGGAAAGGFDLVGSGLAAGSALVYTCYILVGDRVTRGIPPMTLAALVCLGGFGTFGAAAIARGGVDLGFGAGGWFWVVTLVLVSTIGGIVLFFAGLAYAGPTIASLLAIVEPVVTVGAAAVVFGETLRPAQALGGALVLAAVVWVQWPAPDVSSTDAEQVLSPVPA